LAAHTKQRAGGAAAAEQLGNRPGAESPGRPHGLQVIPAENLVAALQGGPAQLFACASSAAEAQLMFEALEVGVLGVVLRSDDPVQVGTCICCRLWTLCKGPGSADTWPQQRHGLHELVAALQGMLAASAAGAAFQAPQRAPHRQWRQRRLSLRQHALSH
jgi:hypothetical protein